MNKIKHAAAKKVFAGVMDYAVDQVNKNPETAYEKIIDTAEKYLKDFGKGVNWDYLRKVACNPEYTLNRYVTSIVKDLHPNVLKTTLMNLGFEAFYNGTKTIHEMREIHKCNIPWIILMDPTSACNLHCTGCWAAEYGNKLNLSFDDMDSIVTQGKELGVYFYMMTGGEPMVRKKDIIELCRKHNDCVFFAYTNGTLVDEALCKQMQEVGNLIQARPEVERVEFESAEQAWEDFQKDYFGDNLELAEGFKDDNPLANSDNYEVYMKTTDNSQDLIARSKSLSSTQQDLVKFAQSLDGVLKVNKSDVVANTLSSVNMLVAYISIAIIAILLGVSIFLISNTVTMGITVRKEEIAIMKYIGAKDFVVRSPFVIEGLIIGIFGAAIPLGLLYVLYDKAVSYVMERFSILKNIIDFLPVNVVYTYLLPIGLIMGIGIGFLGSFFTVRKHLRV